MPRRARGTIDLLRNAPQPVRWGIVAGAVALAVVIGAGIDLGGTAVPEATPPTPLVQHGGGDYLIRSYDEITEAPPAPATPEVSAEIGMDLLLKLAIVVGLIYAAAFVLKRLGFTGNGPRIGSRRIRVIESHSLGPQRAISIVEVGDRQFLVGTTAQQIQVLAELDDDTDVERLPFSPGAPIVSSSPAPPDAKCYPNQRTTASRTSRAQRLRQAAHDLDALRPNLQGH